MKKFFSAAVLLVFLTVPTRTVSARPAARATLIFAGDLMAHSPQIVAARRKNGYDFKPSFSAVKQIISAGDLAVANFETTLGGEREGYTGYPCFSTPDAYADAVKDAGIDVLTTANNHCMDRRFRGLRRTIVQLRKRGFDTCGTYATPADRESPLVRDVNGIRIAFLSWTYGTNGIPVAPDKLWSVARLDSARAVSEDFARVRALKPDFIVALPHVGTEYVLTPPRHVAAFVEKALESGADAVIASHPHVVQPFELRTRPEGTRSFIAWSMGNFISSQRPAPRDMGVLARLTLEKSEGATRIVSADVIPTWVQARTRDGRRVYRVLPLTRALKEPSKFSISSADLRRVREAHAEFTKRVLGRPLPPAKARLAYEIQPSPRDLFSTAILDNRGQTSKRAERTDKPAGRAPSKNHKEDFPHEHAHHPQPHQQ